MFQAMILCNFQEKWTKLEKVTKNLILDHLAQIWAPHIFGEFYLY